MSDKRKDYDPALLRMVGNQIAANDKCLGLDIAGREMLIDRAINNALYARKKLQKIQKEDE